MGRLKNIEVRVRGLAFGLVRPFLKRGRAGSTIDPATISRVLLIRKDRIGDAVCSLPVLAGLKRSFPHLSLAVLCSPRNVGIFRDDPCLDQVFLYRKQFLRDLGEMRRIRQCRFDVVIDLIGDDSVTALFLSQLASKRGIRIGVGKARYRAYYDLAFDYPAEANDHIIDMHLKVLTAFGVDPKSVDPYTPIYMSEASRAKAAAFLQGLPAVDGEGLRIGYNLSVGKPERVWSPENSRALITRILAERPGSHIVLICTPSDRHLGESLLERLPKSVFLLPDGLNMADVSALLARMDLLVTPDTSLVHVARSLKIPVVATYPKWDTHRLALWRPYGQSLGVVMSSKADNVFDITVDEVLSAFRAVLGHLKVPAK